MSQGKLNGSTPTNTGFSPTPNQSTIGQDGNIFGQLAKPGSGAMSSSMTNSMLSQPVAPNVPQATSYVSGLGTGPGTSIGPVAPNDDGIGNDGNLQTPPGATPFTGQSALMNAGYGYPGQAVPDWNLGATPISPGNPDYLRGVTV